MYSIQFRSFVPIRSESTLSGRHTDQRTQSQTVVCEYPHSCRHWQSRFLSHRLRYKWGGCGTQLPHSCQTVRCDIKGGYDIKGGCDINRGWDIKGFYYMHPRDVTLTSLCENIKPAVNKTCSGPNGRFQYVAILCHISRLLASAGTYGPGHTRMVRRRTDCSCSKDCQGIS